MNGNCIYQVNDDICPLGVNPKEQKTKEQKTKHKLPPECPYCGSELLTYCDSLMNSLKEKARFPSDWCMHCQLMPDECADVDCPLNGLWVRLEDAEEQLSDVHKHLEICVMERRILLEQYKKLKQKLQQLHKAYHEATSHWESLCKYGVPLKELEKFDKKFEELLKEEKEAKS